MSAHNGYIEVYLDLGWIGVCLIALILISGYRRAIKAFQRDRELGSLFLAYVATATIYSITEAGFRVLTASWIFLLVSCGRCETALPPVHFDGEASKILAGADRKSKTPAGIDSPLRRRPFGLARCNFEPI